MRMFSLLMGSLLIGGLVVFPGRVAAQRSASPLAADSVEARVSTDEVVVTGTLREVSRLKTPVPTEVYQAKFFQRSASTNLYDGLGQVAGVQPMLTCGVCYTGDVHINGLEGPYTLILIDGMPIVSGLATVYGFSGIPNSIIHQVEIVRGPAGVLYGSEAVAGVINVRTLQPWQMPRFSLDLQTSTYNELNLDGSATIRAGKVSGLVGLHTYQQHTMWDKNGDNFADIPVNERYSVFTKWGIQRPDNKRASLAIRYYYEDRFGGEINWKPENRGGEEVYGESIYTNRVEAIGVYDLPTREHISLGYSLTYHDQNSFYGNTPYLSKQTIAFGQLTWNKTLGKHHVLFGTTFRHTSYDDNTPATYTPDSLNNQVSYVNLPGLFLQDEWQLAEKHTLLLGGRWDQSSAHGAIFSGRLNYKVDVGPLTTVRLSSGNGFRVVNLFTEDHAALQGARQVVLAEALKPEQSWNVNANVLSYIPLSRDRILTLDASAFYTYFTNQILPDYDSDPEKIIYSNLEGSAVSQGVNVHLDYKTTGNLQASVGATLLDVFINEDGERSRQPLTPTFQSTFQLRFSWKKTGLVFDYTGLVYAPMDLPVFPNDFRPSRSPWYSQQHLQVSRKFNNWELYAVVKNILDFVPENPILRPFDPFDRMADDPVTNPNGYTFDTAYGYTSLQGRRLVLGFRWALK